MKNDMMVEWMMAKRSKGGYGGKMKHGQIKLNAISQNIANIQWMEGRLMRKTEDEDLSLCVIHNVETLYCLSTTTIWNTFYYVPVWK